MKVKNYPLWLPLTQGEEALHWDIAVLSCIRFFSLKRGGGAALRCYGGFLRLFLPLEKGELEGDEEMKVKS